VRSERPCAAPSSATVELNATPGRDPRLADAGPWLAEQLRFPTVSDTVDVLRHGYVQSNRQTSPTTQLDGHTQTRRSSMYCPGLQAMGVEPIYRDSEPTAI
jgi:hypothetical protein